VSGQISLPIRRALAIAILIAGAWLLFLYVVQPTADLYSQAQTSIERYEAALGRAQNRERDLVDAETELAQLRKRQMTSGGFLEGTNESIAAARLQERLKSSLDAVKGELKSTQILPLREEADFRRVTVRAQISVGIGALQRTFYDLESSSPYLFLDNVIIRARTATPDRDKEPSDPVLDVSFDLAGYMRRAM
jgi:general secretion pathway protein M